LRNVKQKWRIRERVIVLSLEILFFSYGTLLYQLLNMQRKKNFALTISLCYVIKREICGHFFLIWI